MRFDKSENVELNYNLLILRHMDRISKLTSDTQPDIVDSNGNIIRHGGKIKAEPMEWSAELFKCMIPEELKDEEYNKDIEELKESLEEHHEKEKEYYKKINEPYPNKNPLWYHFKKIKIIVNLLARKGYLFERGGVMKQNNKEEGEVWE